MIIVILDILAILFLLCIIPAAWLVYKKKLTFINGVFLGTFLFLVSFGCTFLGTYYAYGQSPIDITINTVFGSLSNVYLNMPDLSAEGISSINNLLEKVKNMYIIYMPSIIVMGNLLWAYALLMAAKGILALLRKDVSGFSKFSELQMSKMALGLGALSYVVSILLKDTDKIGYVFANFAEIVFSIGAFCGLSVIDFYFRKKLRPSVLRVLIYIAAYFITSLFAGIGGGILMLIGLADALYDFRKFRPKPTENS